jgi:tripartite-type tricarboxylate transporter receptor subunit TctC
MACAAALAALTAAEAWSQAAWRPEKAIEIDVPTGAGIDPKQLKPVW